MACRTLDFCGVRRPPGRGGVRTQAGARSRTLSIGFSVLCLKQLLRLISKTIFLFSVFLFLFCCC